MDCLKALFENGESLTYDQLKAKADAAKMNVVDLSTGSYVSRSKFDDTVNTYKQQVTDLTGQISQRDTDLAGLNTKLASAQTDAQELEQVRAQVTSLQNQYDTDKQTWADRLQQQRYESAIREKASVIRFSSPAAQRDFIRTATEKHLQMDGDALLGYDDFVTKYTADNPGAITTEPEKPSEPTPTVVLPTTQPGAGEKSAFKFHFGGVRAPASTDG